MYPNHYLPVKELQAYIAGYGILAVPETYNEPYFSPPLGLSGFIIHTINTKDIIVAKIDDKDHFTEKAVATGQVTRPVYGQNTGELRILLVFFHPLGMYQLFGNDMAQLTNTSQPLSDFLGKEKAEDLIKKLKEKQEDKSQIDVLNTFFLKVKPSARATQKLQSVLDFIHEKKGDVTVTEIEAHGHYHRKTLERHFKKMVGLSPKVYCQIYQFKCLINFLQAHPETTWSQLAEEAGYYDQSHMSRYIKEYLKVSPSSLVTLDMEFINYLLAQ